MIIFLHYHSSNHTAAPLAKIAGGFGTRIVSYADDTQLVVSLTQAPETAASNFTACMQELALWMAKNCLKLNGNKTEVLVVGKAVGMVLCLVAPEFGNYPRPLRPAKKSGGVDGLKAFF